MPVPVTEIVWPAGSAPGRPNSVASLLCLLRPPLPLFPRPLFPIASEVRVQVQVEDEAKVDPLHDRSTQAPGYPPNTCLVDGSNLVAQSPGVLWQAAVPCREDRLHKAFRGFSLHPLTIEATPPGQRGRSRG